MNYLHEFHFIRPEWLFALFPWMIIQGLMIKYRWRQQQQWTAICDAELLPYLLETPKIITNSKNIFWLLNLSALLAILALAGPTWQRLPMPAFRNDQGLMIALDLSRSMEAADIKPSRLIRAKYKIEDILRQRKDGQIGLLVYAGDAFAVTPLTNDQETIRNQLSALTPDMMPSAGSRPVLAVTKAIELFKQSGLTQGHILLITDDLQTEDINNISSLITNYPLSVLAVGTTQGAPIGLADGGFLKDNNGNIVLPKLPETTLQQLAKSTHGLYQLLSDNNQDVQNLLDFFAKNHMMDQNQQLSNLMINHWDDKGIWLVLLILPLAVFSFRRGILVWLIVIQLPFISRSEAMSWQDLWQTPNQQAQQAFNQHHYDKAAQLFDNPEWKAAALYKSTQTDAKQLSTPSTALGFYNQGNVLAKTGQFEAALKAYQQALNHQPDAKLAEDARYNQALVAKQLQQQKQQSSSESSKNNQSSQSKKSDKPNSQGKSADRSASKSENASATQAQNHSQTQSNADSKPQSSAANNASTTTKTPSGTEKNSMATAKSNSTPATKSQPAKSAQAVAEAMATDEKRQANQQWLSRIPDDPSGLLRRKFRYQYSQRESSEPSDQDW
jgi:Ca-activated chloride channel family protein